jgi:hypothetical protein
MRVRHILFTVIFLVTGILIVALGIHVGNAITFPLNFQSNVMPPGLMQGIYSSAIPSLTDGQTVPLLTTSSGRLMVTTEALNGASGTNAYRAAATGVTLNSTAYDLFYVQGSTTKTVKVKRILITLNGATAGVYSLQLQRHGAIGTGTKAAITPQAYDSRNTTAATCAVYKYTAASGAPTSPLVLGSQQFYLATTNGSVATVLWEFAKDNLPSVTLSGATDFISVSFNGATLTSNGTFDFEADLIEDGS